ncbi:MAG: glycosyltransferase family 2 protein [Candidatus Bathyarchaeum tardum]|nr:MAG: glycosyltransferase family 2 protein [Candidatus Bathyarchaeum tardum]
MGLLILQKNYSITIGIPTKNRTDKLVNCLRAIENQNFRDFNVIIVDGSEGNETEKSSLFFSNSIDILYIKQIKSGVSNARGLIAEHCNSELLLYIDDDVYLNNDSLSKLYDYSRSLKNSHIFLVSGEILYYRKITKPIKLTPQGAGFSTTASNADYILGALMLIPKSVYKKIHWTERFAGWGFEEVLYCLMCKRYGVKICWINSLLAVHDDKKDTIFSVNTEINRVYTMLYKHIFEEPSLLNMVILESAGFLRNLIINSMSNLLSPKKLTSFIFSYVRAWTIGHVMFFEDLNRLKYFF